MTRPTPERLREIREGFINDPNRVKAIRDLLAELDALTVERNEAQVACAAMRALLGEWLRSPFFASRDAWWAWVSQFRPRVERAISSATMPPPPAGE